MNSSKLLSIGEIKQWNTTQKYGHFGQKIFNSSNLSWVKMPIISLACERLEILPMDKNTVPSIEREFWENYFYPEILHIEERIKNNIKEPSLEFKGSSKYNSMKPKKLTDIILNKNSWEGPENLKNDLQFLILGKDIEEKLQNKIKEILNVLDPLPKQSTLELIKPRNRLILTKSPTQSPQKSPKSKSPKKSLKQSPKKSLTQSPKKSLKQSPKIKSLTQSGIN